MVCCSLVNKSCTPGQKDWDKKRSVWAIIKILATEITIEDPEFLLKVGVFVSVRLWVMLSGVNMVCIFALVLGCSLYQAGTKHSYHSQLPAGTGGPSAWF